MAKGIRRQAALLLQQPLLLLLLLQPLLLLHIHMSCTHAEYKLGMTEGLLNRSSSSNSNMCASFSISLSMTAHDARHACRPCVQGDNPVRSHTKAHLKAL